MIRIESKTGHVDYEIDFEGIRNAASFIHHRSFDETLKVEIMGVDKSAAFRFHGKDADATAFSQYIASEIVELYVKEFKLWNTE